MNHGITNRKTGGKFVPGAQGKGDGQIHQKSGSTVEFYSAAQKKKVHVPKHQIHYGHDKRGKPRMVAKGAGVSKDGSTHDLYRYGHIK